jgi:ATP-dependent Clp protease ATP-binding subunit ClpA
MAIDLSKEESLHKYIERKDYLNQLIYILSKRQKNNPLLIGQAGIGKTQLVSALSKKLNQDIYELDLGSLISGTKYRGEMEEKLVNAIKYVINQNAILFIDEVHNIVGAGSNDGSLDVANILKPYLSKGKLKLIAATTLDEYYKYIEKDKALTRRFQTIFIDEPSLEETKNILMGIKDVYEKHYQVYIEERLIDYIIELADNYILNKTFPDKAIDILDETLSRYKLLGINIYQLVKDVISSHQGVNIPTLEELNNYKLYYNELKLLYLRKIKPMKSLKNMGIVLVNNNFNFDLLKKDLEKGYLKVYYVLYEDITI